MENHLALAEHLVGVAEFPDDLFRGDAFL